MKNKTIWIVALMWMAMILFVFPQLNKNKTTTLPRPQDILQKAEALEKAAGNDKDKLVKAIKEYEKLQKIKEYRKTEYASRAGLRIAIIYETKLHDDRRGVEAYKKLVHDFPASDSEIGKGAQERLTRYQKGLDEKAATKPGYKIIDALVAATGRNPKYSYALALLLITAVFKLATTPLSHRQFKSMREMQKVAPLVKQIQEKYKGNQQEIGKRTMALYKEHGINPLSGCLPLLAQMPILMGLYYWVILPYTYQFSKGEFLWIGSFLADKWPSFNILGKDIPGIADNLALPDLPLLVVYTISMIVSQKLSVVDPSQAEQQKMMAWTMPIVFAFIFMTFPSAFMLYWLAFNVIGTAQQYQIMKHPSSGGPAIGPPDDTGGGEEPESPKRPPVKPGTKSKRHGQHGSAQKSKERKSPQSGSKSKKKHFDALPVLKPILGVT